MKLELHKIGQYTDTKRFYICRLNEVLRSGGLSYSHVMEGILTKQEAKMLKSIFDKHGLNLDEALKEISEIKAKG